MHGSSPSPPQVYIPNSISTGSAVSAQLVVFSKRVRPCNINNICRISCFALHSDKAWKWKCTVLASYNESAPPMGDLAPPNKLLLGHPQMVYRLVQPFLQRSRSWPTERQTDQYTSSSGLHLVLQAVLSILLAYSTCLQCSDTKVTGHCIQKSHHLLPAYPGCPGKRVLNGCSSCC